MAISKIPMPRPLRFSSPHAINNPCNPNQLAIRVKINHQIKAPELRVITAEGENLGVITLTVALAEAQKRSLDLIEISPTATPPVAKIMDYGKYQYDEKKKEKAAKAKVVVSELKIVQVKVGTGEHDLELKAKKISEWIAEGNRVKVDLFLIGRSKYMDINFLKERLDRVMKLITVEYKIAQDVTKGPKGLTIVIEKK
ncbi:MAG: translation initiation factor IF-3 [Candidatus Pacebacteria bacterium]|nr:translation initiation factor IF-3 [Candidatus Paceibacterota bacterium]